MKAHLLKNLSIHWYGMKILLQNMCLRGWSMWECEWTKLGNMLKLVMGIQEFICHFMYSVQLFKHFHERKLKFFTNLIADVFMMVTLLIYFKLFSHSLFRDMLRFFCIFLFFFWDHILYSNQHFFLPTFLCAWNFIHTENFFFGEI